MSHYFGFGNIQIDALRSPQAKLTGQMSSGKFQEKLFMKQKAIEVSPITFPLTCIARIKCSKTGLSVSRTRTKGLKNKSKLRRSTPNSLTKSRNGEKNKRLTRMHTRQEWRKIVKGSGHSINRGNKRVNKGKKITYERFSWPTSTAGRA